MGDETRVCVTCGRTFTWSYGEQRFYRERKLEHAPTHCRDCPETRGLRGASSVAQPSSLFAARTPDSRWEEATEHSGPRHDKHHASTGDVRRRAGVPHIRICLLIVAPLKGAGFSVLRPAQRQSLPHLRVVTSHAARTRGSGPQQAESPTPAPYPQRRAGRRALAHQSPWPGSLALHTATGGRARPLFNADAARDGCAPPAPGVGATAPARRSIAMRRASRSWPGSPPGVARSQESPMSTRVASAGWRAARSRMIGSVSATVL
jgi:hypothetical protein